jgi:hypothetical protein
MILYRGPVSSALSLIGGVHIGARARCFTFNLYGLAILLAYPSGEEGGILLIQIISTYLHGS